MNTPTKAAAELQKLADAVAEAMGVLAREIGRAAAEPFPRAVGAAGVEAPEASLGRVIPVPTRPRA